MVPLELQLKNFMSYGEETTTLDLTDMHTVCLSGENGHGKSALLDAMTWALWGETRLGKQNQEQLIRLGADEMSVRLTFGLGAQRYRVLRQRSKRTGGQFWELQQDDGDGRWRPLTGVGAAETGKTIQALLRMSYDTFLNSAYLRQGRADEFVRQTPGRRKEILAEILDLGRYDELEERARLKTRESGSLAAECEQRLHVIDAAIAEEDGYRAQLADCVARAEKIASQIEGLETEIEKLALDRNALALKAEQIQGVRRDIESLSADIKRIEADIAAEERQIAEWRGLVDKRLAIVADYQKLCDARKQIEELQVKVDRAHEIDRKRLTLQGEIDAERTRLERDMAEADRDIDIIEQSEKTIADLTARLKDAAGQIAALEAAQARRELILSVELPEARILRNRRKDERDNLDRETNALQERLQNLANQTEVCSICGSPLPPSKIAVLESQCREELARNAASLKAVYAAGTEIKTTIDRLTAEQELLDRQIAAATGVRELAARDEQELARLRALRDGRKELERFRAQLAAQLSDRAYAQAQQNELSQLAQEYAQVAGASSMRNEINRLMRDLAPAEESFHRLSNAQSNIDLAEGRLSGHVARKQDLCDRLAERTRELAGFDDVDGKMRGIDGALSTLRAQRERAGAELNGVHADRGRAEGALAQIEGYRADKALKQKERDSHRRDEEIYKQLTVAFSKQGIPAIIIQNALPELEEDANQILERTTDGSLKVRISTTRSAKTRSAENASIETLEIQISDHLGTRPLELYSGGESFRISFALRIALSKLTARRAGARLQTLIIDEGFGTQDGKGREKLVESIMAIHDDFEKIIVITHIEELKDSFPSRVEVLKTSSGSQLTVTYGGDVG